METSPDAPLSVKGFPEKQESSWEHFRVREGGRQITECSHRDFSQEDSGELGVYTQGDQESNAAVTEQQCDGHSAPRRTSFGLTVALQHSQAAVKHQHKQVNAGFTALPGQPGQGLT